MTAMLGGIVAALLVVSLLAPVTPADATSCPDPGGEDLPTIDPALGDFSFTVRGWGHGVGLSQHGAQGAARLGCDAEDILATYYPGTAVSRVVTPEVVRIGLFHTPSQGPVGAEVISVVADEGAVTWKVCDDGHCEQVTQTEGSRWFARGLADGSYTLHDETDPDAAELIWSGGGPDAPVRADFPGRVTLPATGFTYTDASLEFATYDDRAGLSVVLVFDGEDALEHYLHGVAEMPARWERAALRAQAIAARSYTIGHVRRGLGDACRCHLRASHADQAYAGLQDGRQRWIDAVDDTRGHVITHEDDVAEAVYASSHGGHSDSNAFVWGTDPLPYLVPIDDSRWERASDEDISGRFRSRGVSARELGALAGVGVATDVRTPEPRGESGRVGDPDRGHGGVVITGTQGEAVLSGAQISSALGLGSTLFEVAVGEPLGRVAGDDRVLTAVAASEEQWAVSDTAVLARSTDFPDALAGAALAAARDAPLLLTPRAALHPAVADELGRLGVNEVLLLGGPQAVSDDVAAALRERGHEVRRVEGNTRFGTAAAVAQLVGSAGDVVLASGTSFADAVSAGALVATTERPPVLLASRDVLPEDTRAALLTLEPDRVIVVGGPATISEAVEQAVAREGFATRRLAGATRYGTSARVATEALDRREHEAPVVFATGADYPDALAAGSLAAALDAALLLVPRGRLTAEHDEFLEANTDRLHYGVIVGGQAAVGGDVEDTLDEALSRR